MFSGFSLLWHFCCKHCLHVDEQLVLLTFAPYTCYISSVKSDGVKQGSLLLFTCADLG